MLYGNDWPEYEYRTFRDYTPRQWEEFVYERHEDKLYDMMDDGWDEDKAIAYIAERREADLIEYFEKKYF